ncbi:hypothetical protein [Flavobacterium adhaerens]|uniref:hypothetical protein n=1 Tax=Flavobacterium adhaerens TaxID=3149043 RepID=UPI0032B56F1F
MESTTAVEPKTITTLGNGTIADFAESLGMLFTSKKTSNNNVCFAEVDELRIEYKDIFSLENLYDYLFALWYSNSLETQKDFPQTNLNDLPIPNDKIKFWELVHLGEELRQADL